MFMITDFLTDKEYLKAKKILQDVNLTNNERLYRTQKLFGQLVEYNFFLSLKFMSKAVNIEIEQMDKDFDELFGVDYKIKFLKPGTDLDGLEIFVDFTLDSRKEYVSVGKNPVHRLTNGINVYLGYKTHHNKRFKYKRPIVVVRLDAELGEIYAPIFTESDVVGVVNALRNSALFLWNNFYHKFNGEVTQGQGKYCSTIIDINENIL
ncbi:MAG: hypothetical protein ACRDBY_08655 [Cetobacterium sp.]